MNFLQSVNAVVKKQTRKVHSLSSPFFLLPFTPAGRGAASSHLVPAVVISQGRSESTAVDYQTEVLGRSITEQGHS